MALVRMQAKGQMTVPRSIRDALGIDTDTEMLCIQTGPESFACYVQPAPPSLQEYLDRHRFDATGPTQEEMDKEIEEGIIADVSAACRPTTAQAR